MKGLLHLEGGIFHKPQFELTQAQIDTVFDWSRKHDEDMPSWFKKGHFHQVGDVVMYTMSYTIEQSEIAVRNFWRRWVTMTLREGTLTELHFLAYWYRRDWREL